MAPSPPQGPPSRGRDEEHPPPTMATMSIPVPHHPTPLGAPSHSPPIIGRSPSYSSHSASSYRSHPYNRRLSIPPGSSGGSEASLGGAMQPSSIGRILLPPPHSAAPLRVGVNEQFGTHAAAPSREVASLGIHSPPEPWRDTTKPPMRRVPSGVSLPPLHQISGGQMSAAPPPIVASRPASPTSQLRYSPRSAYRQLPSPYDPSTGGPSAPRWDNAPHQRSPQRATYEVSPPLRALVPGHSPDKYYAPPTSHYPASSFSRAPIGGGVALGRSRSHSGASAASLTRVSDEGESGSVPGPQGQNRRLAHLMSEQKRRESINSGFASLRAALPVSAPTDSKAVVLRKAVSHIKKLEAAMEKAGLTLDRDGPQGSRMQEEWDELADEGDVEVEETTGQASTLKREEEWAERV